MNSSMKPSGRRMKTKNLWLLAALGFIVFIAVQLFPTTDSESLQLQQADEVISKSKAAASAADFVHSVLNLDLSEPIKDKALITYETRSDLFGYLTRADLLAPYLKTYEKQFPYDVFRVRYNDPTETFSAVTVDVHMTTGQVVGFEEIASSSNANKQMMLDLGSETTDSMKAWEGDLTLAEKEQLTLPYLNAFGFKAGDLELTSGEGDVGLQYQIKDYTLGESQAQLKFSYEYGAVSSFERYFSVPQAHLDYVAGQTKLANWLTYAGYALLTFVLAILAIVYSAMTRAHTSFKRGIFLASLYFVLSTVGTINMMPVFQKDGLESGVLIFGFFFQGLVTLFLAASVYFSLVGGDGLWRKNGINLWPRSREEGYGRYVLTSMADGYAWALILLGAQSVVFFILERTIHTWSTTDATQSPYNMVYPLLLPLLAWVAGIGEEAVYRLFGIPMLKKMFRSTFIASLLSTLIWAFGHTLYPIYPVISRPIELTFIGLLFSFVFLRYGFAAVVFSHVIFDSILMSLSLMFMGGALNISAGIFYIALPAIVAYVIYLFNPPSKERKSLPPQQQKEEPYITTPLANPRPEGHL
ncbi:CPBP family intramembrane metalloprotease [Paenibacillus sp. MBLB2552]|uniref:CPBP family intramembrane metalloprotease n=1 Tax=Paenibacillus mellifer TaxID=2937794 RepID=A0A9X1Y5U6_9BACL|nr:type II CAAX endopeptidase family protein [Paenibacillus mellifer]MCK8489968.1 CPBP family intramembrane metalloprotease [Paenibacillus mellifer]